MTFQIIAVIASVILKNINSFEESLKTDKTIEMLRKNYRDGL